MEDNPHSYQSENSKTLQYLSEQIVDFTENFRSDPSKISDKQTALKFADQLHVLSELIHNYYSVDSLKRKGNHEDELYTDAKKLRQAEDEDCSTTPSETSSNKNERVDKHVEEPQQVGHVMENAGISVNEPQQQQVVAKNARISRNEPQQVGHVVGNAGISKNVSNNSASIDKPLPLLTASSQDPNKVDDYLMRGVFSLMDSPMKPQSRDRRYTEARQAAAKAPKFSQSDCGCGYKGTKEEQQISIRVINRLKDFFPNYLKTKSQVFYFMAFCSLDRICCEICSKCERLPTGVFQEIETRKPSLSTAQSSPAVLQNHKPIEITDGDQNVTSDAAKPELVSMLKEISDLNDWCMLGLDIGLSMNTLDEIRKEYNEDIMLCKTRVLQKWFKGVDDVPYPSWNRLVEIVGGKLVKDATLAKKIAENHSVIIN